MTGARQDQRNDVDLSESSKRSVHQAHGAVQAGIKYKDDVTDDAEQQEERKVGYSVGPLEMP